MLEVEQLQAGYGQSQVLFGALLILIVLYARGGIDSLLGRRSIGHG